MVKHGSYYIAIDSYHGQTLVKQDLCVKQNAHAVDLLKSPVVFFSAIIFKRGFDDF